MAQLKRRGITLKGRLVTNNVTFYTKKGKIIIRAANTNQPLRRTRGQFISRQRIAHNTGLWKRLKCDVRPMFTNCENNYGRFCSLMHKRPVVFLTKEALRNGATLLLPGMPVSEGILTDIGYRIGEAEGVPALLTDLKVTDPWGSQPNGTDMVSALCRYGSDFRAGDILRLYTFRQVIENMIPKVYIETEDLTIDYGESPVGFKNAELCEVNSYLALTGSIFADTSTGWAMVHISDEKCSTQTVVTQCTLYEQYTTEEAMLVAADSYGGLTQPEMITPDTDCRHGY